MKSIVYDWHGQQRMTFKFNYFEQRKIRKMKRYVDALLNDVQNKQASKVELDMKTDRLVSAIRNARNAMRSIHSFTIQ